ncbi:uncharacterized protein DUF4401 [Neolewinella xylanilytica]|uniref:Uncharacterized protein DUF4401 n=1 Tax=Neolewinella xylanilytica TaxID=1514080 RepID=A0A2S6I3P4_9BACT|nr:DUF4401 domain-containing protein [Neolewinella xylanilytica]PPK85783.1 uncharacterized protein DUF4401 [Neolewinella xylanilytica]
MDKELITALQARARVPFTVRMEALAADEAEWQTTENSDQALRVLSGMGGVLSSLLFLLFLWLADLLARPVVSVLLGVVLIVATILLGRTRRQAFLATATVCGYLVGVGLIMVGLPPSIPTAYLVVPVLIIALATGLFTRNYYLILLATVSVPGCLIFLHYVLRQPLWTWLALAVCAAGLLLLALGEHRMIHDRRFSPLRSGLAIGFLLTLIWFRWAGVLFPAIGGMATVLPLFGGCLLLLLVSFRNQHLLGVGLAVAGLFYFTVQYYYDLRWDLLNKSVFLMGTGAVLLAAYGVLHRMNIHQHD